MRYVSKRYKRLHGDIKMIVCNKCGWFGNRSKLMVFYSGFPSTKISEEYCCPKCGSQDYKEMKV